MGLVRKSFMPQARASSRSEVSAAAVRAMIGKALAAWRWLDSLIGLTMLLLAALLARHAMM